MKKIGIILGLSFFLVGTSVTYAQVISEKGESKALRRGDLKGPNAKNIKPGVYKATTVVYTERAASEVVKGPKAKNQKVWEKSEKAQASTVSSNEKRTQLKGPKAKNYK